MILFFYLGDWMLSLFGVDINSFAVAGALILFLMALEMVLGIEIFKDFGELAGNADINVVIFSLEYLPLTNFSAVPVLPIT